MLLRLSEGVRVQPNRGRWISKEAAGYPEWRHGIVSEDPIPGFIPPAGGWGRQQNGGWGPGWVSRVDIKSPQGS